MLNINNVAYGSVVLGGLALFAVGHPKADAPISPVTPGLAMAATAPGLAMGATAPGLAMGATAPGLATVAEAPVAASPSASAPVAMAAAVPPASVSGNGFNLVSLSVDLPSSDRAFPPGPGVEAAEANCAACHSPGMILNQPSLARATWETEVHKMIAVYKAPVSEEDAKTIVAYLDSIKGDKQP